MKSKRAWMGQSAALIVVMMLVSNIATAGLFSKKKNNYDTLIVTGNYVKSRMLAELIQYRAKHPILLLPTGDEADMLYGLGPNGKAVPVHRDRYVDFVRNLQPKTIIFLGDASYIPAEYVAELQERFTVVEIKHADWMQIAGTAGELLDLKKLDKDYRKLLDDLDGKGDPKPDVDPASLFETETDAEAPAAEDDAPVKTETD